MSNNVGSNADVNSYSAFSKLGYIQNTPNTKPVVTAKSFENPVQNMTAVKAQNLLFKVEQDGLSMGVKVPYFSADIYDKTPQDPLKFEEFTSLNLKVKNALIQANDVELSNTIKTVVQKKTDIVDDIDITFKPNNFVNADLKIKKLLSFKVKIEGQLDTNPINNIMSYTPTKINVAGIPIKGMLDVLGLEIGEIVKIGNPSGSYFTSGKSIYFKPTELIDSPKIEGHVTGVQTTFGKISLMVGNSDVVSAPLHGSNNYVNIKGGNVDFKGFNLQDADVTLTDKTPEDDFDLINDPSKKIITEGQVGIPEEFIHTALRNKQKPTSTLKDRNFSMPDGVGKLSGKMWGFLPVKLDMKFMPSNEGGLKVEPSKGYALGFVPLPNSILKKALKEETEGTIEGKGVVIDLDNLADVKTSPLKDVRNEDGKLVLVL